MGREEGEWKRGWEDWIRERKREEDKGKGRQWGKGGKREANAKRIGREIMLVATSYTPGYLIAHLQIFETLIPTVCLLVQIGLYLAHLAAAKQESKQKSFARICRRA